MKVLNELISNKVLLAAILGWIIAQSIKVITVLLKTRKFDFGRVMGSGGMPSSHSATVMAASIGTGQTMGYDTPIFAVSIIIAFVVIIILFWYFYFQFFFLSTLFLISIICITNFVIGRFIHVVTSLGLFLSIVILNDNITK